jgi:sugar phosphate isomerase/epimerase
MDRRHFVYSFSASIAGSWLLPRRLSTTRLDRIGLELYSVRDAMRADPERTLAAVRAMGYTDVELLWSFGNFGRTPQQVRASLDKEGLRAPSAHVAPEILIAADWQKSLDTAKLLGHDYLIVPSLPAGDNRSLDRWREWADRFNTAGAAARKSGVWLAFHNEPDHMPPIGATIPYDLFVERTDPSLVRLQLDVGNMVMGGGDPMQYLERHRDRYWSFHMKDVLPDRSRDTELGKGNVDLRRILAAIPNIQRKPVYVEQEGPADPLASARMNHAFLASMNF